MRFGAMPGFRRHTSFFVVRWYEIAPLLRPKNEPELHEPLCPENVYHTLSDCSVGPKNNPAFVFKHHLEVYTGLAFELSMEPVTSLPIWLIRPLISLILSFLEHALCVVELNEHGTSVKWPFGTCFSNGED